MPFGSLKQELWMKKNKPEMWRRWVREVGHAPGYQQAVKRAAKKAARTRARKAKKKRKPRGK